MPLCLLQVVVNVTKVNWTQKDKSPLDKVSEDANSHFYGALSVNASYQSSLHLYCTVIQDTSCCFREHLDAIVGVWEHQDHMLLKQQFTSRRSIHTGAAVVLTLWNS